MDKLGTMQFLFDSLSHVDLYSVGLDSVDFS